MSYDNRSGKPGAPKGHRRSGNQDGWRGKPERDRGRGERAPSSKERRAAERTGAPSPSSRSKRERTNAPQHERGRSEQRERKEQAPYLPEDVSPAQLDAKAREELATLPRSLAETVARHLVMAESLAVEDPERAYEHAAYARRKASRVGVVREMLGVAAYRAEKWQEALSELRAARRITGRHTYLAVMADCERGLGRPERALDYARKEKTEQLDTADRVELRIVASGARRDLGEREAALVELQGPELSERRARPWLARLFYAYADALLELQREGEARDYFARASAVDREGVTDADERLAELEGTQLVETGDDVVWSDAEDGAPNADDTAREPDSSR